MRRFVIVAVAFVMLALLSSCETFRVGSTGAPAAALGDPTVPVSGSGLIQGNNPPSSLREPWLGTYTSTGPLGHGNVRIEYILTTPPPPHAIGLGGTATLTRSDGASLSGTVAGWSETGEGGIPFALTLSLTQGTRDLVSATLNVTGTGGFVGEGAGKGLNPANGLLYQVFTFIGTVNTRNPMPTSTNDCNRGGWRHLTDDHGRPFTNQGDCLRWVVHHARCRKHSDDKNGPPRPPCREG
jgi:hypothetical protein